MNAKRLVWLVVLLSFLGIGAVQAATLGGASTVSRKGELGLGFDFGVGGAPIENVGVMAVSSLSYHVIDNLGLTFRTGYTGAISADSASVGAHLIPFLFGVRFSVPLVKKLNLVNGFGFGPGVGLTSAKNTKSDASAVVAINAAMGFEYEVVNFLGLNFGLDTTIAARKGYACSVFNAFFGIRYYLPL